MNAKMEQHVKIKFCETTKTSKKFKIYCKKIMKKSVCLILKEPEFRRFKEGMKEVDGCILNIKAIVNANGVRDE